MLEFSQTLPIDFQPALAHPGFLACASLCRYSRDDGALSGEHVEFAVVMEWLLTCKADHTPHGCGSAASAAGP